MLLPRCHRTTDDGVAGGARGCRGATTPGAFYRPRFAHHPPRLPGGVLALRHLERVDAAGMVAAGDRGAARLLRGRTASGGVLDRAAAAALRGRPDRRHGPARYRHRCHHRRTHQENPGAAIRHEAG
eukprot:ctg_3495.g562